MVPKTQYKSCALAGVLCGMLAIFFVSMPTLRVDRVNEAAYLRPPYSSLQEGRPTMEGADPYLENGPHAEYPAAWLVYKTGSMRPMRFYNFCLSLLAVTAIWALLFRYLPDTELTPAEILSLAVLVFAVWLLRILKRRDVV